MRPGSSSAIEVALTSRAKLIALLLRLSNDLATAEDVVAEAYLKALEVWATQGVPDNPDAWLLTVAKNKLLDHLRRQKKMTEQESALDLFQDSSFPDESLKLILLCCHPVVDEKDRTALILQIVLGLSAEEIAPFFLVSAATMSQRLVRAKAKLSANKKILLDFDEEELSLRTQCALESVYAVFIKGWDESTDFLQGYGELMEEAFFLARLMQRLNSKDPETNGLLALFLHVLAKAPARFSAAGDFIPLNEQDSSLWNQDFIFEADQLLAQVAMQKKVGRFQLEAAIQSAHSQRAWEEEVDWPVIVDLYRGLVGTAPTASAWIGLARALWQTGQHNEAEQILGALDSEKIRSYKPYWVLKAHIAQSRGEHALARHAFDVAIGLSTNEKIRNFLIRKSQD